MKKKRVLSLLLASVMIASLAAGCGSGGGGSDNGEEKVTLTIPWPDSPQQMRELRI